MVVGQGEVAVVAAPAGGHRSAVCCGSRRGPIRSRLPLRRWRCTHCDNYWRVCAAQLLASLCRGFAGVVQGRCCSIELKPRWAWMRLRSDQRSQPPPRTDPPPPTQGHAAADSSQNGCGLCGFGFDSAEWRTAPVVEPFPAFCLGFPGVVVRLKWCASESSYSGATTKMITEYHRPTST